MNRGRLWRRYSVAGAVWEIQTNSTDIFDCAALALAEGPADPHSVPDFLMNIGVDHRMRGRSTDAPIFRGRDHLVFADYGRAGFFAIDLKRRVAFGAVSAELAQDREYWRESIFPVVLGLVCLVLDATPLHSACVVYKGRGVLIAGHSGAGKSTLAATLAKAGLEYLSDDWVYLSRRTGRVHAAPVKLKLLPDAIEQFFPELKRLPQTKAMNGEWSVAVDPTTAFSAPRAYSCSPGVVILLDRVEGSDTRIRKASADDLQAIFSEPLDCVPGCFAEERLRQIELIRSLSGKDCFVITCGGGPSDIAAVILKLCDGGLPVAPTLPATLPETTNLDLLRRHASVSYRGLVQVGDAVIDVASDLPSPPHWIAPMKEVQRADLHLDLITEGNGDPLCAPFVIEHDNLIACSLGRGAFIVVDTLERTGMAFVSRALMENGGFGRCMTTVVDRARSSGAAKSMNASV